MKLRNTFLATALALAGLSACGKSSAEEYRFRSGPEVKKLADKGQALISAKLAEFFRTPDHPLAFKSTDLDSGLDQGKVERGAKFYKIQCIHCHGTTGDGNGPTSSFLYPRPRDYRKGVFKFKSTASGEKPTRDDLMRIVNNGVHYTAMPSFKLYDPLDVDAVVEYVMLLSMRGELEIRLASEFEANGDELTEETIKDSATAVFESWKNASSKVISPATPRPAADAASIARGKELFQGQAASCASCHGVDGKGIDDGKKDAWDFPTRPADLTRGIYRGGGRPIDIYRRIHSGINGSPMSAFGNQLSSEQIWDIVNYVYTLAPSGM